MRLRMERGGRELLRPVPRWAQRGAGFGVTLRVCAEHGCGKRQAQSRCPAHRSQREKKRGSSTARGYGSEHRALRTSYQRRMDEQGERFTCWRGGEPIDPQDWTLGHCDDDRTVWHGPECPACDYAVQGRAGVPCPHPSHGPVSHG